MKFAITSRVAALVIAAGVYMVLGVGGVGGNMSAWGCTWTPNESDRRSAAHTTPIPHFFTAVISSCQSADFSC
jgi:hypothetical protein